MAIDAHHALGDSQGEARTYSLLGLVCFDAKDFPRALRAYQSSLDLLGPDAPIDMVAKTGHNLVETLIASGRLRAASASMALLEPLFRRFPPGRLTAKTEWLRARLCREQRLFDAAQLAYERAYDLMNTEPPSPDLAELLKEMAQLPAPSNPI